MQLTANQQKALDHTRNLSVTANAGAGKTTVLIRRYLNILSETDTQVKEIVAITYTEKAASELKKKIAEQVREALKNNPDENAYRKWGLIRDQLTSANIGTIHSFCAQLLREYPVESDVDAAFSVLNNFDQYAFEEEAIRGAITGMLTDAKKPENRKSILLLLRAVGKSNAAAYCKAFLRKRELVDRISARFDFSTSANARENIHELRVIYVSQYLAQYSWNGILDGILKTDDSTRDMRDNLKKWNNLRSDQKKVDIFYDTMEMVFTKTDGVRKNFEKFLKDPDTIGPDLDRLKLINQQAADFDACRSEKKYDPDEARLFETLVPMFDLYREALRRYDEKKSEYGTLDFEDILLKTWKLLKKKEIADAVSSKFRYILVDEFQDTNTLQYDIVHSLALADHPLNLFIVGDAKQSIYGFRDAEVEVFNKADAEISRKNPAQRIVLGESFRLLPNLIDFVNRVFSRLMEPADIGFSITYDQLVQGRENNADGAVELLLVPDAAVGSAAGTDKTERTAAECRMIAERILELVGEGRIIYRGRGEVPGKFEFRDTAILLRGRTHLSVLEKTLREFNIPYIISGGIGYFQTQEVLDVVNYLKFLLNQDDDIALAGILRSPFFAVSDPDIFSIAYSGHVSLWNKLENTGPEFASGRKTREVLDLLHNHLNLAKRLTIPSLIQHIVVDTGWIGVMAGMQTGGQSIANIEKLLRIAREFEERGYPTLYDFVQRLVRHIEEEPREGQAPQNVQDDCVRLLTVHSAKGLEFGAVFLPFLHQSFMPDRAPFIDPDYGIAFPLTDDRGGDPVQPPSLKFLKHRQTRRIEAEEKRILYVACTRARDMLILSGDWNSKNGASYLKWIVESLGIGDRITAGGTLVFDAVPMKVLNTRRNDVQEVPHRLTVTVKRSSKSGKPEVWKNSVELSGGETREYQLSPVSGSISGEFYSATQIATYLECPRKFYLKYHLGVPEISQGVYRFHEEDDANDRLRGDVEGTLTHSVLQAIKSTNITENELRSEIRSVLMKFESALWDQEEKYADNISRAVMGFLRSKAGLDIYKSEEFLSEFKINLALGDFFFTGTIDRLYKGDDGLWRIVDYKTNRLDADEIGRTAEKYMPQMKFYAVLLKHYFSQKRVPVSLIFLRHPDKPYSLIMENEQINEFENTMVSISNSISSEDFPGNRANCCDCVYQKSGKCLI